VSVSTSSVSEALAVETRLVGYRPAAEVVDGVGRRSYLHSGPPLDPTRPMPAALLGGVVAGLLFEGEAATAEEAFAIVRRGEIDLQPCQDTNVVGPLVGLVTPRSPMAVVERADGRRFCAPMHEGDEGGMRTGTFDQATVTRLQHIYRRVAPALDQAVRATPTTISPVALQQAALSRGDECHNRNVSATSALVMELAPAFLDLPGDQPAMVAAYFRATTHHFISLSAATAKAVADMLQSTPGTAGVVTAVGMNGQDLGIKVSGLDGWFRAPSPVGPVIDVGAGDVTRAGAGEGDSPTIETMGLGAFSLSSAPELARAFGYDNAAARDLVEEMRVIAAAESPHYCLPNQDFRPAPAGVDVRKVAATGVAPATTLGFLSRDLGQGRVGAGVVRMPLEPFREAATALEAAAT
jgi:hypothetical protein